MTRFLAFCSSKIFGLLTALRNFLFEHKLLRTYRSALPVICVGNLTVGGNAKTPLCLFLGKALRERGYQPVLLSRGYGGSQKGPYLLNGEESAAAVGDEPLLLFKSGVPVVVARSRVAGAKFIEQEKLGNVIILDDGLQHRWLQRNLDIVALNVANAQAVEDFIRGELLPLGRFREDRKHGLKRAHMLICMERGLNVDQSYKKRLLPTIPEQLKVYRGVLSVAGIQALKSNQQLVPPARVVVFTGIANPEAFTATVKSLRFEVVEEHFFPDHYAFREADVMDLLVRYPDLPLLCTEKDAVKLIDLDVTAPIYVLKVDLNIVPADAFLTEVLRRIALRPAV